MGGSGIGAKLDKDIELFKVTLVSEEIRNRYTMRIGLWIGIYVAIIAGAFALLSLTDRVEVEAFTGAMTFGLFFVTWQIARESSAYRKQLARLDPLIKSIEVGTGIGDLGELLKKFEG